MVGTGYVFVSGRHPLIVQWRACGHRTCYVALPLYVVGFVVLGVALKDHTSVPALVIGWGLIIIAVMMNTVAVCASRVPLRPYHS